MACSDIFLGLIAILFPPIAVWIKCGLCSAESCINILLCMLGYLPGLIHAWYIISRHPESYYDRIADDEERQGHVTYYYISHQPAGRGGRRWRGGSGYGTVPAVPGNKPHAQPPQIVVSGSEDDAPTGSNVAGPAVGAGSGEQGAPPSYSDVVKGDHKIQRQE